MSILNMIMLILASITCVISIIALLLECRNQKNIKNLQYVCWKMKSLDKALNSETKDDLSGELIINLILSKILESLYTSDDPNVIQWKLFHLREMDGLLTNWDCRHSTYLRDKLISLTYQPVPVGKEFIRVLMDKMKTYYALDIDTRTKWTQFLEQLMSHLDIATEDRNKVLGAYSELQDALAVAKLPGAICPMDDTEFCAKSAHKQFEELCEKIAKENGIDLDKDAMDEAIEKLFPEETAEKIEQTPAAKPTADPIPTSGPTITRCGCTGGSVGTLIWK